MEASLIAQRVALQRNSPRPLSRQLYEQLKALILAGALPAESRLPPSRTLAAALHVSRNTVVEALAQLHAEGYTWTNRRGGTRVVAVDRPKAQASARQAAMPARLSERGRLLSQARARSAGNDMTAFAQGVPDIAAFPHDLFARLLARAARHGGSQTAPSDAFHGLPKLRETLAQYLVNVRGLRCEADQIIVVPGAQAGLDLMARLLIDEGDVVWLEDPCYRGAVTAFTGAGANLVPLPVDNEGMSLPDETTPAPRLISITPSHQYPLGTVTSLARRLALLEAARQHNAFVLEDDYDSEFRFDGQPIAALQGLDDGARVIYVGSFAKTMLPSLRAGYLVLPPSLVGSARRAQRTVSASLSLVVQAAIADFIDEGHYRAHVRRMRHIYENRRQQLAQQLGIALASVDFTMSGAGMQIVLHLPADMPDEAIANRAAETKIDAFPLSGLSLKRRDLNGLLLGFGNVPDAAIAASARSLGNIVEGFLQ